MLRNYLKITFRNLVRFKAYATINLTGLTLGIACFLLIYLYVQDERSYDRFHEKANRIYRLVVDWEKPEQTFANALTSAPMGLQLQADFPAVEAIVRFLPQQPDILIRFGDRRYFEGGGFYVDSTIFEVFSFPLIRGDSETALAEPNTVVLTETMARKYFGEADPVGQLLRVDNTSEYKVTGIVADVPQNAHFRFDFLISFATLRGGWLENWFANPFYTYVLLQDGVAASSLEAQLPDLVTTHVGNRLERANLSWQLRLQPMLDIHLHPLVNEIGDGKGIQHLYILSAVALFILLLACVNFINLATASTSTRAKEVGMRKVVGAHRGQLFAQFLGESTLLIIGAMGLAISLVYGLLPAFSDLVGREIVLNWTGNLVLGLITLVALVSLLAGGYPAVYLSGLRPLRILKGVFGRHKPGRARARGALVVFQFAISVILIIATITVYKQLNYMKSKKLGLTPEQVAVIPVQDSQLEQASALKRQMGLMPGVQQVAYASRKPGTGAFGTSVQRESAQSDALLSMKYLFVDYDFIEVLDIELAAGRFFSPDFATDAEAAFVLNEKAVQDLGWQTAEQSLGQRIIWRGISGEIVGVVRNFHFQPLSLFMQPLVLRLAPDGSNYMIVKVNSTTIGRTLEEMEHAWNELAPDWPFRYSFLDDDFQNLYQNEEQFGKIFSVFTFLALFIACLGLFGLATFAVERRTKEMGIRKVLGASIGNIIMLLSKDFAWLVCLANLIAWPIAYLALDAWLQNYAFRTEVAWWVFGVAAGAALLIACFAISTQAFRGSRTNPVEAFRYE